MNRIETQTPAQTEISEEAIPQRDSYQPPTAIVVGKVDKLTMGSGPHAKDGASSTSGYQFK